MTHTWQGNNREISLEGAQMVNWENENFKVATVNMALELIKVSTIYNLGEQFTGSIFASFLQQQAMEYYLDWKE